MLLGTKEWSESDQLYSHLIGNVATESPNRRILSGPLTFQASGVI